MTEIAAKLRESTASACDCSDDVDGGKVVDRPINLLQRPFRSVHGPRLPFDSMHPHPFNINRSQHNCDISAALRSTSSHVRRRLSIDLAFLSSASAPKTQKAPNGRRQPPVLFTTRPTLTKDQGEWSRRIAKTKSVDAPWYSYIDYVSPRCESLKFADQSTSSICNTLDLVIIIKNSPTKDHNKIPPKGQFRGLTAPRANPHI